MLPYEVFSVRYAFHCKPVCILRHAHAHTRARTYTHTHMHSGSRSRVQFYKFNTRQAIVWKPRTQVTRETRASSLSAETNTRQEQRQSAEPGIWFLHTRSHMNVCRARLQACEKIPAFGFLHYHDEKFAKRDACFLSVSHFKNNSLFDICDARMKHWKLQILIIITFSLSFFIAKHITY